MRRLKLTTLFALPLALALSLGAAPQEAAAGLCNDEGFSNGCVTSGDVKNNSLKAKDLKDEPGVDFDNDTDNNIDITSTYAVVRSIMIKAPRAGFVTCISTGHADWDVINVTRRVVGGWDTTGGTTQPPGEFLLKWDGTGGGFDPRMPVSAMRTFDVAAGTTTFSLKVACTDCADGDIDYGHQSAACMYFPTRY